MLPANIGFLVKFNSGAKVQPEQIVITVVDFFEPAMYDCKQMQRITVSLHNGPEDFTVIVSAVTYPRGNVIASLKKKVSGAVNRLLIVNGGNGYGDRE